MRALLSALLVVSAAGLVFGQDTNFSVGPQYLLTGSPLFARSIATPTMQLQDPPLEVGADTATGILIAGAENHTVLPLNPENPPKIDLLPIYYGVPQPSDIEISFAEPFSERPASELPVSILDTGVWQTTTEQGLEVRGYGLPLGEVAARSKAHAKHATRVYTNADIDRLHPSS
jgi:D-serine deaminase-like pyridoxal phosphate-dependent protein